MACARFKSIVEHSSPSRLSEPTAADSAAAFQARARNLQLLTDPRLTGMTSVELDRLNSQLAHDQAAQIEQRCYQQRGGPRQRAPGAGGHYAAHRRGPSPGHRDLSEADLLQKVLAELLAINPNSIGNAIADTTPFSTEQIHTHPGQAALHQRVAATQLSSTAAPNRPQQERCPIC
jgi:hypothetical protein